MERDQDGILGQKVLLLVGLAVWAITLFTSYLDGGVGVSALIKIITGVYEFMLSYMNFSLKVICDMFSFIIGIVFTMLFSIMTIAVIMLLGVPFIACIFAFTDI